MILYIQTEHTETQTEKRGRKMIPKTELAENKDTAVKEMVDILKNLPEARQAYLNGVAAGMAAERRLSAAADTHRA